MSKHVPRLSHALRVTNGAQLCRSGGDFGYAPRLRRDVVCVRIGMAITSIHGNEYLRRSLVWHTE